VREKVKKSLESHYPGLSAPVLRAIHGFATAISKAFFRQSLMILTWPKGPGFLDRTKDIRRLPELKQDKAPFSTQ